MIAKETQISVEVVIDACTSTYIAFNVYPNRLNTENGINSHREILPGGRLISKPVKDQSDGFLF